MEFVETRSTCCLPRRAAFHFRNSGYLWPSGMMPPGSQSSWKTTLTAQDAGTTFIYTCVVHPWMRGKVIVAK